METYFEYTKAQKGYKSW